MKRGGGGVLLEDRGKGLNLEYIPRQSAKIKSVMSWGKTTPLRS